MTDTWGDGQFGFFADGSFSATLDDGTVVASGTGNWGTSVSSSFATGSASCDVFGCTDPLASNYNPAATQDDGSCCDDNQVGVTFYDSWGDGWNGASMYVYDANGDSVTSGTLGGGDFYTDTLCLVDGCYDVVVGGGTYDSEITFNFGSLVGAYAGTYSVAVGNGTCPVYGCTDSTALNFDPLATDTDNSCIYSCTENSVYIAVVSDFYGDECSWDITDASGAVVGSGGPYSVGFNTISDSICVVDGCYTLNLYDSWGDGWLAGVLGSVTLTDGMGGTYADVQLLGSDTAVDFTIGTVAGCMDPLASANTTPSTSTLNHE